MTVDPIHILPMGTDHSTPQPHVQASDPPRAPISGTEPKKEPAAERTVPLPSPFPEHEVKVQVDAEDSNTIVYQVLDKKSGALVYQIPSRDQLDRILQTQELLQRVESHRQTDAGSTPGPAAKDDRKLHGD